MVRPSASSAAFLRSPSRGSAPTPPKAGTDHVQASADPDRRLGAVGIALGHGTNIAMQSARVVLVKSDLRRIVKTRKLSRATMANIRRNLFFAFVYKRSACRSRPASSTPGSRYCSTR